MARETKEVPLALVWQFPFPGFITNQNHYRTWPSRK